MSGTFNSSSTSVLLLSSDAHKSTDAMTSTAGSPAPNGVGRSKRVLPHISDVLASAIPDVSSQAPLESILQRGEANFRQAESARDFGRPDMALAEYLKASIIVVEILPKHRDIGIIAGGPKQQQARYQRLRKQVNDRHDVFEKVKEDIKADNARTGVLPRAQHRAAPQLAATNGDEGKTTSRPATPLTTTEAPPNSVISNGASEATDLGDATSHGSSPPPKAKPPAPAKPASLHGNAIKGRPLNGKAPGYMAQDLSERFSKLRSSGSGTETPPANSMGNSAASHPPSHRPNLSLGRAILPDLPNPPAPIYSPSRGTLSGAVTDLPSSTERVSFDRTSSAISLNGSAMMGFKQISQNDYFNLRPSSPAKRPEQPERKRLDIPEGQTLSVDELVKYMNAGSTKLKMLVIDVRSREDFDEGHIMAQECICIEGHTLQRIDSSASDLLDSMVLSPDLESDAFRRRHDYDLIVFYDESSTALKFRRDNPRDLALTVLFHALVHFDSPANRDAHTVKLLRGGIAAWIDKMGERSLTTSAVRAGVAAAALQRRRPRAKAPNLRQDEIDQWEEKLRSGPPIVRDTEQFFRRGGTGAAQESMTAPVLPDKIVSPTFDATQHDLALPQAPSRPAPAVPRPTHKNFAEPENHATDQRLLVARSGPGRLERRSHIVGLENPGAWCYGNSSLQALFGTGGFSQDLSTSSWQSRYQVGKKSEEKIAPPQMMTKILANTFNWMQHAKFNQMRAKTLMVSWFPITSMLDGVTSTDSQQDYIHHIHGRSALGGLKSARDTLGAPGVQQDTQEFMSFVFDQVDDETNTLRSSSGEAPQPSMRNKSPLQGAKEYWQSWSALHDSVIDKYWRGIEALMTTCQTCKVPSIRYQVFEYLNLAFPERARTEAVEGRRTKTTFKLETLLEEYVKVEVMDGDEKYMCDTCNTMRVAHRQTKLARLPDRFAIFLWRFVHFDDMSKGKINNIVKFPITGLDLTPWSVESQTLTTNGDAANSHHTNGSAENRSSRQFDSPFIYDCYAAVQHIGNDITHGHYVAYVKDDNPSDPTAWHKFDDTLITPKKIGGPGGATEELYGGGNAQAYLVFYQRRGSPGT
jgi:ubiquitin carboxyl-terminal hydrolase 8